MSCHVVPGLLKPWFVLLLIHVSDFRSLITAFFFLVFERDLNLNYHANATIYPPISRTARDKTVAS